MTEVERVNQEATIDARDNFKAIDERLEELKNKVHNLHLKDPDRALASICLFSGGFFLGSRRHGPMRWLLHFISGGVFGYAGARLLLNVTDKKKNPATVKKEKVATPNVATPERPVQEYPDQHPKEVDKTHLQNVKIIEPVT